MRLVMLCKRRPQGRDLLLQPYGRFFHIPRLLAGQGHEVHQLLLNYESAADECRSSQGVQMYSVSVWPWGPWRYLRKAREIIRFVKADWIIGFSDIWYGLWAQRLGAAEGVRVLIDAYDNYESYIPWAGALHKRWRRSMAEAAAVTAAGPQLARLMSLSADGRSVGVVPMAADPGFTVLDKVQCRARLGLPPAATLVGYAGALYRNRGIEQLFAIVEELRKRDSTIELVLSGRLEPGVVLPAKAHWLGYRPPEDVPAILNSLDLLFVMNKPGAFGDYSYPAKLYEAMACNIPVVAADVAGTAWILRNHPTMLARAGDVKDFADKATENLAKRVLPGFRVAGWEASAALFEEQLGLVDWPDSRSNQ